MTSEDKPKEECGVFGVFSKVSIDIGLMTYMGLNSLQHRGEESSGVAYVDDNKINLYKDLGCVSQVFDTHSLNDIKGKLFIAHVRYSTSGGNDISNAQPLIENFDGEQISMVHNGNIINASSIREKLEDQGYCFKGTSDSEGIIKLIRKYFYLGLNAAVIETAKQLKGSYSILILNKNKVIALRDPLGIRPLCIGKIDEGYIICSESCALSSVGASPIRDILPGEMVVIDQKGIESSQLFKDTKQCLCAFEYVYFARADSIIDGLDVNLFRVNAGAALYEESKVDADIVMGVPDSAIPYALGYSRRSKIPFDMGIIKNKYVGRTFISSKDREKLVTLKLNVIKSSVENKRVVVIDDSLVRGTTSKVLVKFIKDAGAKEVHLRIASPMVKYPCAYGIDIKTSKELVANNFSKEEMKNFIGVDSLEYLSMDGFKKILGLEKSYCTGCFNGRYPR